MKYFSAETLRRDADRILMESSLAANDAGAQSVLRKKAATIRADAVPTASVGKPVVAYDVFLSHSSLDIRLILGLYTNLTRRGYSVYLDKFCDPQLDRTKVTSATAKVLRYRIAQSKSLFVATTSNTPKSNWVPWELGFSDGWNGKAAILPLIEAGQTTFSGQEYFGIYPEVRDANGLSSNAYAKPDDLWIYYNGVFDSRWGTWINKSRTF